MNLSSKAFRKLPKPWGGYPSYWLQIPIHPKGELRYSNPEPMHTLKPVYVNWNVAIHDKQMFYWGWLCPQNKCIDIRWICDYKNLNRTQKWKQMLQNATNRKIAVVISSQYITCCEETQKLCDEYYKAQSQIYSTMLCKWRFLIVHMGCWFGAFLGGVLWYLSWKSSTCSVLSKSRETHR